MTTGIRQAEIAYNPVNRNMTEMNSQARSKQDKPADGPVGATDTINIKASVSEKPAIEFEPIDEEKALILSQLVATDLSRQSVGISTREGMDVLRLSI